MTREEAKRRAEALVEKMTVEEKASQLRYDAPAIDRLGIPAYNWWNEALHGVARAGTATVFPQAIGLAAIFDPDFHQAIGDTVATEGRAKYNVQSTLGDRDIYKGLTFWSPNINIFRDPRWGRGHETLGEDPYLTGKLGTAYIKGLQGDGPYLKAAACAKHFAVHSGPEAIRHEFNAIASQKDMEETYLPAFEMAVKDGHVEAVMGCYNRVNGEPACGSKTLLKDILRGRWGFEGHVVSDCWAINDFHLYHHVTDTAPESAALAITNGCDLNCGVVYLHLLEALKEGLITEEDITRACVHVFTTRYMLGLFAEDCPFNAIPYTENDTDAHHAQAQEAAEKSMVLLKNDGILPLDPEKVHSVAVIGPNADSVKALIGNYHGTSSRSVTLLAGIRDYCGKHGIRVFYSEGSPLVTEKAEGLAHPNDRLSEAVACAEAADVIIACVGLDETLEGEQGDTGNYSASGDKVTLRLPAVQEKLLETLSQTGKPMVTVLAVGSSLNVPFGNAQLLAWYAGQAGGTALARILFGEVSPSGKLPVTFYQSLDDLPAFEDYSMANRTYRYYTGEPLYPFGYGLSYSKFELRNVQINAEKTEIRATVENTGAMDAETVVEVYAHRNDPDSPLHPHLIGFGRAAVRKGEQTDLAIALDPKGFTVVDEQGQRRKLEGEWDVYVGFGQPDARTRTLTGETPVKLTAVV